MPILKNPYEGLWEKHLSIDEMDMILESRTGGKTYGNLSILSGTNDGKSIPASATVSGQAGSVTE